MKIQFEGDSAASVQSRRCVTTLYIHAGVLLHCTITQVCYYTVQSHRCVTTLYSHADVLVHCTITQVCYYTVQSHRCVGTLYNHTGVLLHCTITQVCYYTVQSHRCVATLYSHTGVLLHCTITQVCYYTVQSHRCVGTLHYTLDKGGHHCGLHAGYGVQGLFVQPADILMNVPNTSFIESTPILRLQKTIALVNMFAVIPKS